MKTMSLTVIPTGLATGLLSLLLALPVIAQQTARDFPSERSSPASCDSVNWNANMLEAHPRLIDACQEVVMVDGNYWARFDVRFKEIQNDGTVVFDVRDRNGRAIEQASFLPFSGQMAYIDNRATQFRDLRRTDAISLYVPEGQYGFATRPGVPIDQVARASAPTPRSTGTSAPVTSDRAMAQTSPRQSVLPATSSHFQWFALFGFLALFTGTLLTLRRWS